MTNRPTTTLYTWLKFMALTIYYFFVIVSEMWDIHIELYYIINVSIIALFTIQIVSKQR